MRDQQQILQPSLERTIDLSLDAKDKQERPRSVHLSSFQPLHCPQVKLHFCTVCKLLHIQKDMTVPAASQCRLTRLVDVVAGAHIQPDVLEEVSGAG